MVAVRANCPRPWGVVAGARFRFPVSPPEEPRDPGLPSGSPLLPRASHFRGSCRPARIKGIPLFYLLFMLVKARYYNLIPLKCNSISLDFVKAH